MIWKGAYGKNKQIRKHLSIHNGPSYHGILWQLGSSKKKIHFILLQVYNVAYMILPRGSRGSRSDESCSVINLEKLEFWFIIWNIKYLQRAASIGLFSALLSHLSWSKWRCCVVLGWSRHCQALSSKLSKASNKPPGWVHWDGLGLKTLDWK